MKIRLPVESFVGITLASASADGALASVVLDHSDPSLSIPLLDNQPLEEAAAIWKAWGSVLGLALWRRDPDGDICQIRPGHRALRIGHDTGRRRRRYTIKNRRPSILLRRKSGRHIALSTVHRGEREIIARS